MRSVAVIHQIELDHEFIIWRALHMIRFKVRSAYELDPCHTGDGITRVEVVTC